MSDPLQVDRGQVHVELVLRRPECRNALSSTLIADLTTALHEAAGDSAVRAIILTGAPPAFCAGLDLRELAHSGVEHDSSSLLALLETIEWAPKPVIAAVNGSAVAGGAALVSVCDLAICAESASLGYPGVKRGLVAPIVMTYLWRLIGERHARFLLLTGETISARRALEIGLVNEVVPDAEVLPRARHWVETLAGSPAHAVAATKALLGRLRAGGTSAEEMRRLSATLTVGPGFRTKPPGI
jgi:methylglutaconyl-CoA hydratase